MNTTNVLHGNTEERRPLLVQGQDDDILPLEEDNSSSSEENLAEVVAELRATTPWVPLFALFSLTVAQQILAELIFPFISMSSVRDCAFRNTPSDCF